VPIIMPRKSPTTQTTLSSNILSPKDRLESRAPRIPKPTVADSAAISTKLRNRVSLFMSRPAPQ
jgi:hypothetical protein